MFAPYFIRLVQRVLASSRVTELEESHSDFAAGQSARLGPLYVQCLSLCSMDYARAYTGLREIPWPKWIAGAWRLGHRDIGFQVCCGADRTERTGFHTIWF